MLLQAVDIVEDISDAEFKTKYYDQMKPVILKNLSKRWPAYEKWTWDYFIKMVGAQEVGVYNNVKSDAYTPINTADAYMKFGDYLQKVKEGPLDLRIFLFNIFQHAPEITQDFNWPENLMKGFVKKYPMLFVGGQGAVTHIHFDIDMSHILHSQFIGRKKVLLFPFSEQHKLYRKPWEVLSQANFANYSQDFDYERFPATRLARGYELILEHGDTLFMPAGYWHHMEYLEAGFAMSIRALQNNLTGRIDGVWKLFGMRYADTLMKKTFPKWWYDWKIRKLNSFAEAELRAAGKNGRK